MYYLCNAQCACQYFVWGFWGVKDCIKHPYLLDTFEKEVTLMSATMTMGGGRRERPSGTMAVEGKCENAEIRIFHDQGLCIAF